MKNLFSFLFNKWEVVYSTQDLDDYYKVKEKLSQRGFKYKTESISSGGGEGGGYGFATTYHIKVKKEDVNKSSRAIHH
jgi:hypothetical protein